MYGILKGKGNCDGDSFRLDVLMIYVAVTGMDELSVSQVWIYSIIATPGNCLHGCLCCAVDARQSVCVSLQGKLCSIYSKVKNCSYHKEML